MLGFPEYDPNRLTCQKCGDEIETWKYELRRGFWDDDTQTYRGSPITTYYCQECFDRRFGREPAAHTDADVATVWSILDAADGELVADLREFFVGGHPFVRVVDGDIDVVSVRRNVDKRVVTFEPERIDRDRDWFFESVKRERVHLPDTPKVLLRPVDETPFAELPDDPDQSRIDPFRPICEFDEDDGGEDDE